MLHLSKTMGISSLWLDGKAVKICILITIFEIVYIRNGVIIMSWFESVLNFIDDVTDGDSKKITAEVRAAKTGFVAYNKTVEENGFFKTVFTDDKKEVLNKNIKSEVNKPYYEMWMKIKEEPNFSPAITRFIWSLFQSDNKYYRDAIYKIAYEDISLTQSSYKLLKSDFRFLYDFAKDDLDNAINNQISNRYIFNKWSKDEIQNWIKTGEETEE